MWSLDEIWEWLNQHRKWSLIGGGVLLGLLGLGWAISLLRSPVMPAVAPTASLAAPLRSGKASGSVGQSAQSRSSAGPAYVDIKGAVRQPGLYHVTASMRIADVLKLAQGLLPEADQQQVNLAEKVTDQQVIYVPRKGEAHGPVVSGPPAGSVTAPTNATRTTSATGTPHAPVNINTADVATFQTIKGIGQKKAEKIIAYRQVHGDFKRIEDLKQVGGFGDKTIAKFKDQLTV